MPRHGLLVHLSLWYAHGPRAPPPPHFAPSCSTLGLNPVGLLGICMIAEPVNGQRPWAYRQASMGFSTARSHLPSLLVYKILHYLGLLLDRHDTRCCLASTCICYIACSRPGGLFWCSVYIKSRNIIVHSTHFSNSGYFFKRFLALSLGRFLPWIESCGSITLLV